MTRSHGDKPRRTLPLSPLVPTTGERRQYVSTGSDLSIAADKRAAYLFDHCSREGIAVLCHAVEGQSHE